jgi:para-nitrobenzyl esterase
VFAQISASGTPTPLTTAQYEGIIQASFGAAAGQVLARYPVTSTISPDLALANEITDAGFACPAHTANQLFAKSTRTYAYEFSDPNPIELVPTPPDFTLGDTHSVELTYLFQGLLGGMNFPLTPPQRKLSNQMIDY